jgi:lipopolysaccharide export system permease protein
MTVFSLVDRYIGRSIAFSTLLVMAVLLGLFMLAVFVDELPDMGRGNYGLIDILIYTVLTQPRRLYEAFPAMLLIGTLMGLSLLARNSEIVALRAAGVSIARIIGAAAKTGAVFVLAAVALGELVVPKAETLAQTGRAVAMAQAVQEKDLGIWLRDEQSVINFREVLPDRSLIGINILQFSGPLELERQMRAERARFKPDGWVLKQVEETLLDGEHIRTTTYPSLRWRTSITSEIADAFTVRPEGLSLLHLQRYIQHLQRNDQDARRYRLVFWQKFFTPVAALVMLFIAAPIVFRPIRSGGLSQRIFLGVMLGLTFIVVNRSFGFLGVLYGVPPFLGAFLPVLLFSVAAMWLLRRAW